MTKTPVPLQIQTQLVDERIPLARTRVGQELDNMLVWREGAHSREIEKLESLNTTMLDWFNTVIKGARTNEELVNIKFVFYL